MGLSIHGSVSSILQTLCCNQFYVYITVEELYERFQFLGIWVTVLELQTISGTVYVIWSAITLQLMNGMNGFWFQDLGIEVTVWKIQTTAVTVYVDMKGFWFWGLGIEVNIWEIQTTAVYNLCCMVYKLLKLINNMKGFGFQGL